MNPDKVGYINQDGIMVLDAAKMDPNKRLRGNSTCNSCVFYPLCNGLSCRFDDLCNKYHDTTLHEIRMQYK